jgi:hypothetical protein
VVGLSGLATGVYSFRTIFPHIELRHGRAHRLDDPVELDYDIGDIGGLFPRFDQRLKTASRSSASALFSSTASA